MLHLERSGVLYGSNTGAALIHTVSHFTNVNTYCTELQ